MIVKHKSSISSRERVKKTFQFEKTDRVPINYSANPTIHSKLAKTLGINTSNLSNTNDVLEILDVDFRSYGLAYTGPFLYKEIPGLNCNKIYGIYTKWIENESGGYEDYAYFPLDGADPEIIANYPVVDPDHFNYEEFSNRLKNAGERAAVIGGAGFGDIINHTGMLMGMENTLVNLMLEDEATLTYTDRRLNMQLGILERQLKMSNGRVDVIWLGEDLGTQIAPMISLEMYKRIFRPRQQRFIDLAKSYNIPVIIHGCGC